MRGATPSLLLRVARVALVAMTASVVACDRGAVPTTPASSASSASPHGPGPRPLALAPQVRAPVVVAIVVDQLSAWVAASRWPELPDDGAFARLRREGTWVKNLRYPFAITDTAPGHAALHTGKVPAESGIVGNELPGAAGRNVSILRDEATRCVAADGVRATPGSSASRLRADTVADRLRAAHPDALVVSVSVKDRGAILPAGRRPSHVLWFDAGADAFVSSTAFTETYPSWAVGIGDGPSVVLARTRPWELGDRAWVAAHAAGPDAQPGEGDLDGLGTTFPHVARTAAAFRATPASDGMILDLALAAIDVEYNSSKPTLLLLSMSASDIVGHVFGPDSWEAWDQLRKLDARLALFLSALERRVGPATVLLAADHGNLSMPEITPARAGASCPQDPWGRPCASGVRVELRKLDAELAGATRAALGPGDWISAIADPYLFLTPASRALSAERRARLDAAVRATIAKHGDGIADVIDARMLAERCPDILAHAKGVPARARIGEDVLTLVCRSWAPVASAGDYYLVPKLGSLFDSDIVPGKGASHGSPHVYDRTVPMLVRAPGLVAAGAVVDEPVDFSVFAALEAALVGLDAGSPREILAAHTAR